MWHTLQPRITYILPILRHCSCFLRKKGIWAEEKNIGRAYCSDTSFGEFFNIHGKLLLKETSKNLNANNFQCIYGWSRIHKQNRRAIYVSHFQNQKFLRAEPPTEVQFTSQEAPISCDVDRLDKAFHGSFDPFRSLCRCSKVNAKICGMCTDE